MTRLLNDLFLQTGELGESHLDAEVAARHHDGIARAHHVGEVADRLGALDLHADERMAAGRPQKLPRLVDVGAVAREGHRQIVHLERRGDLDVLPVLVGERARGEPSALAVDALAVAEFTPHQHPGANARCIDRHDLQADLSVIEQQHVPDVHVVRQLLVGDADRTLRARIGRERGVEREFGAVGELDAAAAEALDPYFGPLQIPEHAHIAARGTRRLAQHLQPPLMVGDGAVREIEAHDVHARPHHLAQHLRIVRRGAEGGDDLGPPKHVTHE
jgi:hypothetical protein